MHCYRAYGLHVHSELLLPAMVSAEAAEPDVVIQFGHVDCSGLQVQDNGQRERVSAHEAAYAWEDVGAFLVRNGKEIIIDPDRNVEEQLLRLPVLGILLAAILYQRGMLVLHASAVAIHGEVAVFMAAKGWGKSTLAAMLYGRGHDLIADDLVAIDLSHPDVPMVIPGFPQLKLFPEAARFALGDQPDAWPQLAIGYEKLARRGIDRFAQVPLPLKGIYQLAKGAAPALKPLGPQEALVKLIANTYFARISHQLPQDHKRKLHFHQWMSLIKQIPVYGLERPQALASVTELAQLVEASLGANAALTAV